MMAGVQSSSWADKPDPTSQRERLQRVFSLIDKDKDGCITTEELRQCWPEADEAAIKALDVNQDGTISFEQFYTQFKSVTPLLESVPASPFSFSTPVTGEGTGRGYVLETDSCAEDEPAEWETIKKKFSISEDSPLYHSKELRDLIGRLEMQSPQLLDQMEHFISFLHCELQQMGTDCQRLQTQLKRNTHYNAEQAMQYDEVMKEEMEKQREEFVAKEQQTKIKLEKELREKEELISQVLSQKIILEEQLNQQRLEQASLQEQNKQLESAMKHRDDAPSPSTGDTPVNYSAFVSMEKPAKRRLLPKREAQSSISEMSRYMSVDSAPGDVSIDIAEPDHLEYCDVSFELSNSYLLPNKSLQKSRSAISLAEEFQQLKDTPPSHTHTNNYPMASHEHSTTSTTTATESSSHELVSSDDEDPLKHADPDNSSHHDNNSVSHKLTPTPQTNSSPVRSHDRIHKGKSLEAINKLHQNSSSQDRESPYSRPRSNTDTKLTAESSEDSDTVIGSCDPHINRNTRHSSVRHAPRRSHDRQSSVLPSNLTSSSCPNISAMATQRATLSRTTPAGQRLPWLWEHPDMYNALSANNIFLEEENEDSGDDNFYHHYYYDTNRRAPSLGTSPYSLPPVSEEGNHSVSSNPPSRVYKVVFLGNSGVGKSSVIRWLETGSFTQAMEATIGMDYITRTINVGSEQVLLQLWDTAGQERFGPITAVYCRRADAFILVYDITNRNSFIGIKGWMDIIKATLRDESSILLLLGNKRDSKHEERQVSTREGQKLAEQLGALFMETSARSGNNVLEAHRQLAWRLLEREDEIMNQAKFKNHSVYLDVTKNIEKKKCFC